MQYVDYFFNAVQFVMFVFAPLFIAVAGIFLYRIVKSTDAFVKSEDFRRMDAAQKDIPASAVAFPVAGVGITDGIYLANHEVFLPIAAVTNQAGAAMKQAGMKYLRLDLNAVTDVTCLTVTTAKGAVGFILFNLPNLPKTIAIFARRGLGDPPPELFDVGKFLDLAGRHLSCAVKDLGQQKVWQVLKYM